MGGIARRGGACGPHAQAGLWRVGAPVEEQVGRHCRPPPTAKSRQGKARQGKQGGAHLAGAPARRRNRFFSGRASGVFSSASPNAIFFKLAGANMARRLAVARGSLRDFFF
jgi:hypothetical protein